MSRNRIVMSGFGTIVHRRGSLFSPAVLFTGGGLMVYLARERQNAFQAPK
jgi:hypothetical protein